MPSMVTISTWSFPWRKLHENNGLVVGASRVFLQPKGSQGILLMPCWEICFWIQKRWKKGTKTTIVKNDLLCWLDCLGKKSWFFFLKRMTKWTIAPFKSMGFIILMEPSQGTARPSSQGLPRRDLDGESVVGCVALWYVMFQTILVTGMNVLKYFNLYSLNLKAGWWNLLPTNEKTVILIWDLLSPIISSWSNLQGETLACWHPTLPHPLRPCTTLMENFRPENGFRAWQGISKDLQSQEVTRVAMMIIMNMCKIRWIQCILYTQILDDILCTYITLWQYGFPMSSIDVSWREGRRIDGRNIWCVYLFSSSMCSSQ